jgi:hypothetical protein
MEPGFEFLNRVSHALLDEKFASQQGGMRLESSNKQKVATILEITSSCSLMHKLILTHNARCIHEYDGQKYKVFGFSVMRRSDFPGASFITHS